MGCGCSWDGNTAFLRYGAAKPDWRALRYDDGGRHALDDGSGDTSGGIYGVGLQTVVGGIESVLGIIKLPIVLVSTSAATGALRYQLGIPSKCKSQPLLSWQPPIIMV